MTTTPSIKLDFVGIGAARAGTTWLARCLDEHPDIFIPSRKELKFFHKAHLYDRHGPAWLDRYFKDAGSRKKGEYTPRYMIHPEALRRIKESFPDIKIIVSLRDPVDRSLSQYKYFRFNKRKEPAKSYLTAVEGVYREDYIVKSLYFRHMRSVLDTFDRSHVYVSLYEHAKEKPLEAVQNIYHFLEVRDDFVPTLIRNRINYSNEQLEDAPVWLVRLKRGVIRSRSIFVKNPLIKPVLMRLIRSVEMNRNLSLRSDKKGYDLAEKERKLVYDRYFREDVEKLERLLDMNLAIWKEKYASEANSR
jgi:hypothetical protein